MEGGTERKLFYGGIQLNQLIYYGEADLPAFSFAYTSLQTFNFTTSTDKYKHVIGQNEQGEEVHVIWFKEENAG